MTAGAVGQGGWRKGVKFLLYFLILGVLAFAGYYYYAVRTADLDKVARRASDLPTTMPANLFIQLDRSQLPLQDSAYAIPGHYTIIVYHQKRCPDCRRLDQDLDSFLELRKDVAVRKIDLGEQWSGESTVRDYGRKIWWTPFIVIYDVDGKPIRADDGGKRVAWKLLRDWIAHEFNAGKIKPNTRGSLAGHIHS